LFTIIFMTMIATLVRRYALWKAQEGATIAELEQYQASTSLPNTVKMIVLLRVFNLSSLVLIFIWSWYYLGSQAVSREFKFQLSAKKVHTQLIFPSAEVPSAFQDSSDLDTVDFSDMGSFFTQAVVFYVEYGANGGDKGGRDKGRVAGSDLSGNALLPLINMTTSDKGWCDTRDQGSKCMRSYTTSLGFPMFSPDSVNLKSTSWLGTYEFSSSYVYANCHTPVIGNASDFPMGAIPNLATSFNVTKQTSNGFAQVNVWTRDYNSSLLMTCTLERHYIDARAVCDTTSCIINQARPTPGKAVSPASQFLDADFSESFFKNVLLANGIPLIDGGNSWIQIFGPYLESYYWSDTDDPSDDLALGLSVDMTMLINTYMAASQSIMGYFYPPWNTENKTDSAQYFKKSALNVIWPFAQAKGATYNPRYVLSIPWITVDIFTCTLLFVAAMASYWLRRQTIAPDIFGYVSSMTRDNPHMNLPTGGSTMSGSERARALKNVRVKVAHVHQADGVGHIGLAAADSLAEMGRLEKKKHYM
jgi:hypothetical protein